MGSQFLKTTPVLRMFDIHKARELYLDFLGFKLDFEHRFEPDLPLDMGISLGSAVLHLSEHLAIARPAPGSRSRPRALRTIRRNSLPSVTAMRGPGWSSSHGARRP